MVVFHQLQHFLPVLQVHKLTQLPVTRLCPVHKNRLPRAVRKKNLFPEFCVWTSMSDTVHQFVSSGFTSGWLAFYVSVVAVRLQYAAHYLVSKGPARKPPC